MTPLPDLLKLISPDTLLSALLIVALAEELGLSDETVIRLLREGETDEVEALVETEMIIAEAQTGGKSE